MISWLRWRKIKKQHLPEFEKYSSERRLCVFFGKFLLSRIWGEFGMYRGDIIAQPKKNNFWNLQVRKISPAGCEMLKELER